MRSATLGAEQASAEDHAQLSEFDAVVESALAGLKPQARRLVLLVDVDGLSYAEAAAVLGVPKGTVMSRFHRHLEICKKCDMKTKTYEAIKSSVDRQGQKDVPEDAVADLEAFACGLSQEGV